MCRVCGTSFSGGLLCAQDFLPHADTLRNSRSFSLSDSQRLQLLSAGQATGGRREDHSFLLKGELTPQTIKYLVIGPSVTDLMVS